jgi:hypothetical protein
VVGDVSHHFNAARMSTGMFITGVVNEHRCGTGDFPVATCQLGSAELSAPTPLTYLLDALLDERNTAAGSGADC